MLCVPKKTRKSWLRSALDAVCYRIMICRCTGALWTIFCLTSYLNNICIRVRILSFFNLVWRKDLYCPFLSTPFIGRTFFETRISSLAMIKNILFPKYDRKIALLFALNCTNYPNDMSFGKWMHEKFQMLMWKWILKRQA